MERLEFIEKIFILFRKNLSNNEDLIRIYDDAFCKQRKAVDWDKLYDLTVSEAETSNLPMPQWFTSKFDMCLKPTAYAIEDGIKIRVNLKDGYNYEFETYQTNYTLPEIKANFMKKF